MTIKLSSLMSGYSEQHLCDVPEEDPQIAEERYKEVSNHEYKKGPLFFQELV